MGREEGRDGGGEREGREVREGGRGGVPCGVHTVRSVGECRVVVVVCYQRVCPHIKQLLDCTEVSVTGRLRDRWWWW